MTSDQQRFLVEMSAFAATAKHPYPDYAACEAALESAWGQSLLAREANNFFGEKVSKNWSGPTISINTREYLKGAWVVVPALWKKFPTPAESFQSRCATLQRLAATYAGYKAALAAPDGETFVREVSKNWSTDPLRADKVLSIYRQWLPPQAPAAEQSTATPVPLEQQ